ncbi:AMP-binding protein [Marinomonas transparens]|uniref:AMP-binding protein n=1 Tax=Marinomonas transparens TaxID=2795388 RepID=A0A934JVW8_9GAMM|nr:AMP-binding protein [Marinomonas transparens]MBJ7539346.1 AMP-binding protein [Marinomonas transparens]
MKGIDHRLIKYDLTQEGQKDSSSSQQLGVRLQEVVLDDYLEQIKNNLFENSLHKIALVFDGKNISYHHVGVNVAKIISAFKQQGLRAGSVVAICLRKSPEHIYTTLACALTGIVWLPIDVESPAARLEYLLSNSHADAVVSEDVLPQIPTIHIQQALEDNIEVALDGRHFGYPLDRSPAYYLYTSGSTGTPKCVVLNNQATANVLQQTIARWNISNDDVFMAVTPFHHDMSVFDIFAAMSIGATLVIPTFEQHKNALEWAKLVATNHVTIWSSVPAIVDMLFTVGRTEQLKSLRLIAQGGDYIKPSLIALLKKQLPNTRLFSLGGPTETTIWSIWHEIHHDDQEIIPYGKSLANNEYFILDENYQPCDVGEVGKMYMSGINLSNGYLLNGEIQQKDFLQIRTPNHQSETVFQMSDLGCFREDRTIIFSGREEGYLKVKGVRIAATEVENAISKHPFIHDVVVVSCVHPVAEINELVAIYTEVNDSSHESIDLAQLRHYLKVHLPSSHIPSKCLLLEKIPLTANGKVDRKALLGIAQERLYDKCSQSKSPSEMASNVTISPEITTLILDLFGVSIKGGEEKAAPDKMEIAGLNIRPKQLMSIAKQLSEQCGIAMDFYSLVKCRTIQDVMHNVQNKLNAN